MGCDRKAERVRREIVRLCHAGLDSRTLRAEALRRLRAVVPFEASFFATADPATLLYTGAVRDGIRTTARIVSTRVKGHLNQDPYVVFELEVTPETGAPYRTSVTELVSQLAIPRIQPDAVVDVHVHPEDDRFVVIDPVALGR